MRPLAFLMGALAGSAVAAPSPRRGYLIPDAGPIRLPPVAAPAAAVGALAIGALAVGALAIGALAVGRLAVRKARLQEVEIDSLTVRRFRVIEEADATQDQKA